MGIYQRCDPAEPLEPDDPRNYDIDANSLARGGRWLDNLEKDLLWARPDEDGNVRRVLFSGLIGSGKSTELRRLAARFRERRRTVVRVNADRFIDLLAPLHIADLFLAMLGEADREVAAIPGAAPPHAFAHTWTWLRGLDVEGEQALPDTAGEGASLAVALKRDADPPVPPAGWRLRNGTAFLLRVRAAFRELQEHAKAHGRSGLVVVVDSLEHLRGGSDGWMNVVNHALPLFSGGDLDLPIPTLYTVPPSILLHLGILDEHFFPMVKLHVAYGEKDRPYEPGVAALRALIQRRLPEPQLRALFGDAAERCVGDIIRSSGGYPRLILKMLQEIVKTATPGVAPAVDYGTFATALTRLQQPMLLTVTYEAKEARHPPPAPCGARTSSPRSTPRSAPRRGSSTSTSCSSTRTTSGGGTSIPGST